MGKDREEKIVPDAHAEYVFMLSGPRAFYLHCIHTVVTYSYVVGSRAYLLTKKYIHRLF